MATGYISLPIPGGTPPDGSTSNISAQPQRTKSSATAPALHFTELLFDASTIEWWYWQIQVPGDYSSSPVLRLKWKANATTNSVVWGCRLGATTAGDTDTPNEHAMATANTATTAVNATEARRLVETSITLTNADSMAANDMLWVGIYRDASNGSDTCTVDAELVGATIEYTTA